MPRHLQVFFTATLAMLPSAAPENSICCQWEVLGQGGDSPGVGQVLRLRTEVEEEGGGGEVADRRLIRQVWEFTAWRQDQVVMREARASER